MNGLPASLQTAPLLAVRGLHVGIGGRSFCRKLDFELHRGQSLAIVGRNGAGKSTLLSTLAGLRPAQAGQIELAGQTYARLGARQSARLRGWLPQTRVDAVSATVLETALVGRHPHLERWGWEGEADARIVRAALAAVDLAALEQRDVQSLSGGERQRLAVATLLAQDAPLMLLDEPLAHLDLKHQIAVLDLFAAAVRRGASVVMVLHDPALARRYCDLALLVDGDGHCDFGPVAERLTAERLSQLYDYPLHALESGGHVSFVPK